MKKRIRGRARDAETDPGEAGARSGPGDADRSGGDERVRTATRELAVLVEELHAEIRERIRTEESLRDEKAYREAIESCLHVGVVAVDLEGRHHHVNNAFCGMTGFSRDALIGAGIPYRYWPPDKRKIYAALMRKIFRGGTIPPEGLELRILRPDGRCVDALWHVTPLVVDEEVRGYVASVHDMTGRKRTESALRESEERFRSLVAHVPVGICIVADGRVVFANPEQERFLRDRPGSGASGPFLEVHPEDAPAFAALCREGVAGDPASRETDLRLLPCRTPNAAAEPRWVRCKAATVRHRGRDAVLLTMMDITRAKELEHLVAVREKLASLGQLSAGIAHEIRNPLSGINIYLASLQQFIERSPATHPDDMVRIREIVEQIKSASAKIASVIRHVMDFSKPTPPRVGPVNVNQVVAEAVRTSLGELQRHGISVSKHLAQDLPVSRGDPHLMEQVLQNLISNAVFALKDREEPRLIEVASAVEDGRVVVRVADSGPGVPDGLRRRIFDPFFTTRKDGYGIGLSFSHRVVTEHGGSLTVGRSRWGGAEFRIELPAAQEKPGE